VRREAGMVVSGRLINASGHGLAGWVWLNLPGPGSVNTTKSFVLARGRTDARGRFSLSAKDEAFARNLATKNGGWVNLELLAGSGHFYVYRSVPRAYIAMTGKWIGAGRKNKPVSLVIAHHTAGVAMSKKFLSPPHPFASGQAAPACHDVSTVIAQRDSDTVVGELHTAKSQTASFTYGTTADSNIAVGFTGPGAGGWSLSGETHVANSLGSSVTWTAGADFHHLLSTGFHYVKRKTYNNCFGARYTVKATAWNGGETIGANAPDPSGKCRNSPFNSHKSQYAAGGIFRRHAQRAVRYGGAARVLGLSLSATSGYSKNVEATWTFSGYGSLCGDTDFPTRAQRIFAGN